MGINHWFGLSYTFFFFADTFSSIPYYALGAELTDSYEERNSVYFWQNGFGQLGTLLGMMVPQAVLYATGNERFAFTVMALMFACVHCGGLASILVLLKERPLNEDTATAPFVATFRRVLKNPACIPLLLSWILDYSGLGLISAMLPLWIQYVLIRPTGEDPGDNNRALEYLGYCAGALFLSLFLSMPFWLWLGKKVGKHRAWLCYNIANCVTNPWFFFCGEGNISGAIIVSAMNGFAAGGQFYVDSVTADVVDYDEFLNGNRLEGTVATLGLL